jgi:hypothetical protein
VQQLKHLRLTRSLGFVAASSVYTTSIPAPPPPPPPWGGAIGALRMVPGRGYGTYLLWAMGNAWAACCVWGCGWQSYPRCASSGCA